MEQKFNEEKNNEIKEIDNCLPKYKIKIDDKKLNIYEFDKIKNIEYKIYEFDDLIKFIKQFSKVKEIKEHAYFKVIKLFKSGIFIIQTRDIATYGAFFFMKFNESKKEIEFLKETINRRIYDIIELPNGYFKYVKYFHSHQFSEDCYYIYDIKNNEMRFLREGYEGCEYHWLTYTIFSNGLVYTSFEYDDHLDFKMHLYLNIVQGKDYHKYIIDFIGDIDQIIYDDIYIYLLKQYGKGDDNRVYIFNIEKERFYPNFIKILYEKNKIKKSDNSNINKKIDIQKSIFYRSINNNSKNAINIIYHDENLKFDDMEIIYDSQFIEKETKGTLILSNDLENLDLLLKKFKKDQTTSKFILIVNGGSSEKTFDFITNKNYNSLFINGIIYTGNLEKYKNIKEKHPDFFKIICVDSNNIVQFIKEIFEKIKDYNENYYANPIINFTTYKDKFYSLHKELSRYYGIDYNKYNIAKDYYNECYNDFIKFSDNEEIPNDIKETLLSFCQSHKGVVEKNYEEIIISYLKDENVPKLLNLLLIKKDISIYQAIGYFISNIMLSIVEYGKKAEKGVNSSMIFYKGMQLNIVDLLEYLKNRGLIIIFPNFVSLSNKKDFAEKASKRNLSDKERKDKEFYSVIMKINYFYNDEYKPSVFNLKDLSKNLDEEEFILLPFTFLKLKSIKIDSSKYIADFELDIIGKRDILEYELKKSKTIQYDKKKNIMVAK